MKSKTNVGLLQDEYIHLADAFSKIFISVIELDLATGDAITLKSSDAEVVMEKMPWETLLSRYTERRACPEDHQIIMDEFSTKQLEALVASGRQSKSIEVRWEDRSKGFEWVELSATMISPNDTKMLITTRNVNEGRLLKSIVERFVYANCDYFILLDTKRNSFVRFMGNDNGTDLPPSSHDDYSSILKAYNDMHVMPYDADRVTHELKLANILASLEHQEEHFIYFDGKPERGTVRRKRIQMVYQDRAKGLVLFTRTDITEGYRKERERNEQLAAAIIKSQTDSLTGLYNQAATADVITRDLSDDTCCSGTFLFMDVDNFKKVNDLLGHLRGDSLLVFVANSLKTLIGDRGIVGRIGGDEFLIFLPNKLSVHEIKSYAQKICQLFEAIQDDEIRHMGISCSVGISLYPQDGTDYETLVRKADGALYDSKRQGKSKYCFHVGEVEPTPTETMISSIDHPASKVKK